MAEGCPSCSFISDHIDAAYRTSRRETYGWRWFRERRWRRSKVQKAHGLAVPLGVVKRDRFQLRLPCVDVEGRTGKGEVYYNYGMQKFPSEERPGTSVFYKDAAGSIFHTYSSYGRGLDILIGAYNWWTSLQRDARKRALKHTMAGYVTTTVRRRYKWTQRRSTCSRQGCGLRGDCCEHH